MKEEYKPARCDNATIRLMTDKRIGFVGVSPINGAGLRRYQGYLDPLLENGLPIDEKLIVGPAGQFGPNYSTQDDGYAGIKKLLALRKRPTAVFARNDFTAMGAMCAIRDAGLGIPEEIAIVGFDNAPLAAYTTPPLTTVDQPTREQGRDAARLLLDRIEGDRARVARNLSRFSSGNSPINSQYNELMFGVPPSGGLARKSNHRLKAELQTSFFTNLFLSWSD